MSPSQACGGFAKFEISQNLTVLQYWGEFGRYPKTASAWRALAARWTIRRGKVVKMNNHLNQTQQSTLKGNYERKKVIAPIVNYWRLSVRRSIFAIFTWVGFKKWPDLAHIAHKAPGSIPAGAI